MKLIALRSTPYTFTRQLRHRHQRGSAGKAGYSQRLASGELTQSARSLYGMAQKWPTRNPANRWHLRRNLTRRASLAYFSPRAGDNPVQNGLAGCPKTPA